LVLGDGGRRAAARTFDGRIQLVEYQPRVLDHPPLDPTA
jgi:hypothetical protein